MTHTELNLRERRRIEDMLNAKAPIWEIAEAIGRHRSTIYREIKRNAFCDEELPELNGYYGLIAQKDALARRARRRKLLRLETLRLAIIDQLKIGWTPEQIAGHLELEGFDARISHETIYAWIYGPEGRADDLARHLPSLRKRRKPRHARRPRGRFFPPERSIHQRPDCVKFRKKFGKWEGDLMIFERATRKMNVASLVERKTRFTVLFRNNDRSTTHFMRRLMTVMEPLPQPTRQSITFDRGIEFRDWRTPLEALREEMRKLGSSRLSQRPLSLHKCLC